MLSLLTQQCASIEAPHGGPPGEGAE